MPFLTKSTLSRDTLKILWSVVDSASTGYTTFCTRSYESTLFNFFVSSALRYLTKAQFYVLMRLIALALSPTYAQYGVPTLQMYAETLVYEIPLPTMGDTYSLTPALATAPTATPSLAPAFASTSAVASVSTLSDRNKVKSYEKGERLMYMLTEECLVVAKHLDDYPNIYYTVQFADGNERQTIAEKLTPLAPASTSSASSAFSETNISVLKNSPNSAALLSMSMSGDASMNSGDTDTWTKSAENDEEFTEFSTAPHREPSPDLLCMSPSDASPILASSDILSFSSPLATEVTGSTMTHVSGDKETHDEEFEDFQEAPQTPSRALSSNHNLDSTKQVVDGTETKTDVVKNKDFSAFDRLVSVGADETSLKVIDSSSIHCTDTGMNKMGDESEMAGGEDDEEWDDFVEPPAEVDLMGFDTEEMVIISSTTSAAEFPQDTNVEDSSSSAASEGTVSAKSPSLSSSSSADILSLFGPPTTEPSVAHTTAASTLTLDTGINIYNLPYCPCNIRIHT